MAGGLEKGKKKLGCRFYMTDEGNEPVRQWLKGLAKGPRQEIGSDLGMVQVKWPIGKPLVDGLGGGLYELRSSHNRVEYRVLFYIDDGDIVCLHGFAKKTKKTRPDDVAVARKRMRADKE